jgi:hypothetical protein
MKVFISHSMKDKNLVDALHSIAASLGIEPLIAEHILDVQNTITAKIQSMILDSDLVLVVLTREGFNSTFVQHEVGFATGKKPILILVEKGYESKMSGFVYGRDYVSIDPWNPQPAFEQIRSVLTSQKQQKEEQKRTEQLILLAVGVLFFAALTSK